MSTRSALLRLLSDHAGEYVSGEMIGDTLGVSRAAISKACASLREDGYIIESRTNKGYMLAGSSKGLTESGIMAFVDVPCHVLVYDVIDSTNEAAKTVDLGSDSIGPEGACTPVVIIADKQTAGKGRLGRRFESPAGTGLYMSFAFRPDFDISRSLFVTMASAVGTCRAIEKVTGKHAEIKWVNDLFYNGKKVSGILTEAQSDFETGTITRLITGIGVNCFPGSFPPEVAHIAGSLADDAAAFSREKLAAEMINEILPLITEPDTGKFMDEYCERCFILGHEIKIHPTYNDNGILARAIGISEDGGLSVEYLEKEKAGMKDVLHTGEISISIND